MGQGARFTDSEWFIIEGDEYDTAFFDKRSKFVHYLPEVAIINNLEFDHADIFENLDPSRPHLNISSGWFHATACCWPTATTRIWRRCST